MQQRPASPPPMIRYDPGLWDPDLQRQFMSEAIELVEISVSKKEWPEACKHQEKVLEVAGTILRTHGGANCDPRVNIPTLEQELAGFFYAAGEHERCIKLLKKLLDSNPLRKLDAGTQWKLLYDISKAYNGKQKFHEAAAHGQEAWGKAEKYFLPQDERITATAKLLVDIFHQNDDLARGNAFKRRLEKHESFQKFASKYPEYSLVLTPSGISPVIQAAKDGHANTVRKFLEELPVWRDEIDKSGATVLICAASNKHLDVIRKLQIEPPQFAFGISASTTDLSCETALHRAMRRPPLESNFSKCYPASNWMSSAKEIVRILLDADADTRIQNTDGETCAHICVQNGHTDILRSMYSSIECRNLTADNIAVLLTRNPELISIADSERRTLLHTAIETGQEDLIPILLDEYGRRLRNYFLWIFHSNIA
ncbi:ankyrin [Tothia fuscella]|uniref:Ankyrin n=1 Tax=Tothia fuscella TaxID=1048955 RepID=A0A9P4NJ21_9PEZI|nr:ankyrin [Tothia fuscella]